MKNIFKIFAALLVSLVFATSCNDIEGMSDANSIESFVVTAHSPQTFELGKVDIEGENIFIPIEYGKYLFPLKIKVTATFNEKIDQIIGVDFDKEIVLESLDTKLRFRVVAESGLAQTYYICPREVPLEESNAILTDFQTLSLSQDIPVYGSLVASSDSTMNILTIGGEYPIGITPRFELSPLAKFTDFKNGTEEMSFVDDQTPNTLKVIAQSGLTKDWYVYLRNLIVANGENTSGESRLVTDFNERAVTATVVESASSDTDQPVAVDALTQLASVDEVYVDNLKDTINIAVSRSANGTIDFPLSINFKSERALDAQYIGFSNDTTLVFESLDDTKSFYTIDTKNFAVRQFTFTLEQVLSSAADIVSFSYSYSCYESGWWSKTACVTLDKNKTQIFAENSEIYLAMTKHNNVDSYLPFVGTLLKANWYLDLKPTIKVSPGASYKIDDDTYWGKGDNTWTETKTITVTAEDKTTKQWKVYIKDTRGYKPLSACALNSFEIDSHSPNFVAFDPATPVTLDAESKTVTLKLFDDIGGYPLSVTPKIEVSLMATSNIKELVFADESATNSFTITAEDGTTSDWTVKLEAPARESAANIAGFNITAATPSGITVDKTEINTEAANVSIYLSGVDATMFPISLNYDMTLSLRATSSTPLRDSYTFDSYKDIKTVTVVSESSESKDWTISIISKPQFANSDLNDWMDTQTATFWTNANNGTVQGTSRTTGASGQPGDYAALMTTKSTVGKIAAGSLFTGWFDTENVVSGMNDPISLTFFGVEFASSAKIKGLAVDVAYHAGDGPGSDTGSATIDLIYFDKNSGKKYVYHGATSLGVYHKDNTAVSVASNKLIFGNKAESGVQYVPDNKWTRITIPLDYDDNVVFTHLNIVFSSGAKGDQFIGKNSSTLKVDNIEILYE